MATKLKNMRLTSVDLVRNGANQEADICLFKSADPTEAPEQPTTEEKNIFKRFLNWLRENPTEAEHGPENPVAKADEQPYLVDVYKSAITESIQSIAADDSLSAAEKNDMIAKSLDEYHEAMLGLFGFEPEEEWSLQKGDDMSYLFEDLEKSDYEEEEEDDGEWDDDLEDEAEEVEKFNPNHDSLGRFASGGGGGSMPSKVVAPTWSSLVGKIKEHGYEMDSADAAHPTKSATLYRDGDEYSATITRYSNGEYELVSDNIRQVGKSSEIDVVEEVETVEKFNPNHGADGRFTTANGGGGSGGVVSRRNIDEETDEILEIERELAGSRSSGSSGAASGGRFSAKDFQGSKAVADAANDLDKELKERGDDGVRDFRNGSYGYATLSIGRFDVVGVETDESGNFDCYRWHGSAYKTPKYLCDAFKGKRVPYYVDQVRKSADIDDIEEV